MHFLQLIMSCGAGVAVVVRETGAIFNVGVFYFSFFAIFFFVHLKIQRHMDISHSIFLFILPLERRVLCSGRRVRFVPDIF